jgi:antitoxin ParD1/3/4
LRLEGAAGAGFGCIAIIYRYRTKPTLKKLVDGQIAEGRYSSVSEYVRELIRADEKRKAEDRLEALLLEGLKSAESEFSQADLADIRREALERVKARKSQV